MDSVVPVLKSFRYRTAPGACALESARLHNQIQNMTKPFLFFWGQRSVPAQLGLRVENCCSR